MVCFTCNTNPFRSISIAMAKAASAKLRKFGAGRIAGDWAARAAICEHCPLRVVRRGVSYCGTPFLQKIDRDPVIDGCGCPTREKAKSPAEHCPLEVVPAGGRVCGCKWCVAADRSGEH